MPFEGAHQQWSSTVSNRWMVALALIAAAPAAAAAQFTTFIAPPNPIKDSIKAVVVAEQKSLSDSITHAQITDMKTWVDSAAGIAAIPRSTQPWASEAPQRKRRPPSRTESSLRQRRVRCHFCS